MQVKEWLNNNKLSIDIWNKKYRFQNENLEQWLDRVSGNDVNIKKLIKEKKFLFGGRVLANRGLDKLGKKITLSNCYVLKSPEDNIESIYDTAKEIARTFSYSGGCGTCLGKLAPKGSKVNNAANVSSGAVSFGSIYDTTAGLIGSGGRAAALMLTMPCWHPDVEDFISIKSDLHKLTEANLSVKITDEFMENVESNAMYNQRFVRETGDVIEKKINATDLFNKIVEHNYNFAEPGIILWDKATNWSMVSEDPEYILESSNPCGEQILPAYSACGLGSINLIAYVKKHADGYYFDFDTFKNDIPIVTKAMNDVLEEGIPLHPLPQQREAVAKYRQIGIGIFSLASTLMLLKIKYGSQESIDFSKKVVSIMLNEAVKESALLAKDRGAYPAYNYDYIIQSKFYQENIIDEVKDIVAKYGLRNSHVLSIAPTGTLSNLFAVSGGIEPLFATSYTRRTESLHGESVSYKVYDSTVEQIMKDLDITDEKDLPDYVITAQEIPYKERISMQAAWQQYVDASISSTINLPNSATVDDIYDIYIEAWKAGLKGVTVYRDGCAREGVLSTGTSTPSVSSELKRGDWKAVAKDTLYPKIKLTTGCGKLALFPGWSVSEQKLQEVWVKRKGKGGCIRSIDAIVIEASAILRLGGNLDNISKAFDGLEECKSFIRAQCKGKELSKGSSCAECILIALQEFEERVKGKSIEIIKEEENFGDDEITMPAKNSCPECGADLAATGGCYTCIKCGYSKCN